jgi:hypothetical protein
VVDQAQWKDAADAVRRFPNEIAFAEVSNFFNVSMELTSGVTAPSATKTLHDAIDSATATAAKWGKRWCFILQPPEMPQVGILCFLAE